jgi:hypothetical protein
VPAAAAEPAAGDDATLAALVTEAIDWAACHGLLVRPTEAARCPLLAASRLLHASSTSTA